MSTVCQSISDSKPATADVPAATSGKGIELTAYDEQRQAHAAITDDTTEVVVAPRSLTAELCCAICLDLLTQTTITKECLHRFCHDCINAAITRGNRECPTCRKKLASRRCLRADPNFDALIAKIYPSREEYNLAQTRAMERFSRQCSTEALQRSIQEGIRAQAKLRKQRVAGSYDYEKKVRRKRPPSDAIAVDGESTTTTAAVDDATKPAVATALAAPVPTAAVVNGGGGGNDTSSSCSSTNHTSTTAPHHTANHTSASPSHCGAAGGATTMAHLGAEIELILQPEPLLKNDSAVSAAVKTVRYLKTTIEHLCEYLRKRIDMDIQSEQSASKAALAADHGGVNMDERGADATEATRTVTAAATVDSKYTYRVYAAVNDKSMSLLNNDWTLQQVRQKHFHSAKQSTAPITLLFNRDEVKMRAD